MSFGSVDKACAFFISKGEFMKISNGIFSIALCLLLCAILMLSACESSYSVPPESDFDVSDDVGAACIVTEKTEYTLKDKLVRYKIINNSDILFSKSKEDYILQKYEKSGWENCNFKESREITYEFYEFSLSKGESTDFEIIFKNDFDVPMDKGYYRIVHFGLISNVFSIE